ncbi:DNA internalization-related competence protein ComEC/Rec2 [Eubacterium sp. 1001713B170207_170306_E7]|uniref:DNA internalization-related competence protein ComEC/Rec2 n=1 Tax=Eubacterium sp. 1001713B170207_170306_E7 TaxID=2787097 RepID=UPI001899F28A|nr:DNA internalization-related competence protein ComEC/Rec2 [Eubacterium sp. 1001713B170207_170306_E7]
MKRPLIYALAALCCAILLAGFGAPLFLYALLPVVLLPLPLVFKKVKPVSVGLVLVVYLLGCAAAVPVLDGGSPFEDYLERPVSMVGLVDSVPSREGEKTRFVLKLQEIDHTPVSGKVMVTVAQGGMDDAPGAVLSFKGEISEPAGRRNPGGFDYALYLKAKGIDGQVYLKNGENVTVAPGSASPVYAVYSVKQCLAAVCDQFFTPAQSGLIRGILLGDSAMEDEAKASFRDAGVSHVLAISGLHVGYVYALVLGLLTLIGVRRRYHLPVLAVCLLFYITLTGFSPSVIRAALMCLALVGGRGMAETYDALNGLCLAGIVILLLQPAQLFMAGFQLSFSAVLAIILFYRPLMYEYGRRIKAPGAVASSLILTFCATLGTMPASLYHFHTLNLVALISNLLIVPLVGLLLVLALAGVPLAALFPAAGRLICLPAAFLADGVLFLTGLFSKFSWLALHRGALTLAELLLLALAAFLLAGYFNLNKKTARYFVGVSLPLLLLVILGASVARQPLRVTFLDVGQGDSALVETPAGGVYLIDGGGYETYGDAPQRERTPISESVLLPVLYAKNIRRIDGVFISHNHADHAQGIEELLAEIPVGQIYVSSKYNNEALLSQNKIPVQVLSKGSTLESGDGLAFEVLWPESKREALADEEQNDASMLLRLRYGSRSFLFTGDAGFPVEQAVVRNLPETDVLKVGHHGSRFSTSPEFLKKLNPSLAVISVGRYNSFGHPTDEVLENIGAVGAVCKRTDKNGAVEVWTDGENLKIRSCIDKD